MTDIIERLRALAHEFHQHAPHYREAADEIETLRERIVDLADDRDRLMFQSEQLRGEIEQYRERLGLR